MKKIGVFVGSLRKESFSKKIAEKVVELFPKTFELEFVEIGHLPFYNQDFDSEGGKLPQSFTDFRKKVGELDGFIFVTPEYNRSVPAVLKNALDVASRPPAANKWGGKPALVISQSPGSIGGFGANHHLRQSLACLNVFTLQQPEAYISFSAESLDETGKVGAERTVTFLQKIVDAFVAFAAKFEK